MMSAVSILKTVVLTTVLLHSVNPISCDGGREEVEGNSNYYRVQLIRRESALSPLMRGHHENLTKAERMQLSVERSKRRLERLQAQAKGDSRYYSPVIPEDGGFIMQMGIGSPRPLVQHMILDTGSDLIWVQCKPCALCYEQDDPLYNPLKSSTYTNLSCTSNFCTGSVKNFCDYPDTCGYYYSYGDGQQTTGVMAREAFSMQKVKKHSHASPEWEALPHRLLFGCGHRQEDGPTITIPGLAGLGRGPLSLVPQLRKVTNYKFSYCFAEEDDDDAAAAAAASFLLLGDAHDLPGNFQSTPFVGMNDPDYGPSFYYLDLHGISVGGTTIRYPASTFRRGGLIIDSGSTKTSLVDPAYKPLVAAVKSSIKAHPLSDDPLCYRKNLSFSKLPRIAYHFAGNATFFVPPRNSFLLEEDDKGREFLCLAYDNAGAEGKTSIFGNSQQQNYNVVYDLAKNKLSYAPAVCKDL